MMQYILRQERETAAVGKTYIYKRLGKVMLLEEKRIFCIHPLLSHYNQCDSEHYINVVGDI